MDQSGGLSGHVLEIGWSSALCSLTAALGISSVGDLARPDQVVSRTGKLAYEWRGLAGLPQLLDRLVADKVTNAA